MKKLLTVTLALFILLTLSGCNKEVANIQPFSEESLALIEKYDGQNFDNSYNIKVEYHDPNTDTTTNYTFYDFLTSPKCMFKKISAQNFMQIVSSEEELSQMFILLGDKSNYKTYQVMQQMQEIAFENGIVTFYVDTEDIRKDPEVFDWFHERFNYNEIALNEYGYKQSQISDLLIPTPIIMNWWNQVFVAIQLLGPNFWDTEQFVKDNCWKITDDFKDYYPLGCEQIKYDLGGRI